MSLEEAIKGLINHYKRQWFCTCKEQNHTVGCTRTTNRKLDDLAKELPQAIRNHLKEIVPEEKEIGESLIVDGLHRVYWQGFNQCRAEMLERIGKL